LQQAVADTDNWGLAREVTRYCKLNDDITTVAIKIEQNQHDLDAIWAHLSSCESRLMLTRASERVAMLQNLPRKVGAIRSGWKRNSRMPHGIHVCTVLLEDE
jgi:hypothetical protein